MLSEAEMDELPADILKGISSVQAEQSGVMNQTETIRFILRDWLIGHGYLKAPPDDPEMAN